MPSNLQAQAERGEVIYRERYKADYEKAHTGMFAVIGVDSERIFIADTPEAAYQAGVSGYPCWQVLSAQDRLRGCLQGGFLSKRHTSWQPDTSADLIPSSRFR